MEEVEEVEVESILAFADSRRSQKREGGQSPGGAAPKKH